MTVRSERVRLFQTLPHACGYFHARTAQNLVLDPAAPNLPKLYALSLARGFRRAGGHIYHPHCPRCHACEPCRIDVATFTPNRSQRRCLALNHDVAMSECEPALTGERQALYARYLRARHPGGGMDEASDEDFSQFLTAPWSPTVFLEFRLAEQLVAVAVTDVCETGLSAVYTFFDPDLPRRGLGTYAILRQIELARARGLPHLYLGYWIANHPKMGYKSRFGGLQVLGPGGWARLAK
ncbi:MAG: Arginyl-tRNA--protein transferase [Rhodanobacteraceae bacterium]|jgi:arginine-tRNA-protein transferase|nr:MAG: Arginyl-tRNA--protein transferase [Rhodanobacteraceae bacterium]